MSYRPYNDGLYFYPRSPCGERLINTYHRIFGEGISIHALLAESDPSTTRRLTNMMISIHALLAESDHSRGLNKAQVIKISIHALLAESDVAKLYLLSIVDLFLSTLSLRRATFGLPATSLAHRDFYPRSPCGERQRANSLPNAPPQISIHALLAESDFRQRN